MKSQNGTRFRQWATERLKNYLVKGFDIDVERLKGNGGGQYWYEFLNTINAEQICVNDSAGDICRLQWLETTELL